MGLSAPKKFAKFGWLKKKKKKKFGWLTQTFCINEKRKKKTVYKVWFRQTIYKLIFLHIGHRHKNRV